MHIFHISQISHTREKNLRARISSLWTPEETTRTYGLAFFIPTGGVACVFVKFLDFCVCCVLYTSHAVDTIPFVYLSGGPGHSKSNNI